MLFRRLSARFPIIRIIIIRVTITIRSLVGRILRLLNRLIISRLILTLKHLRSNLPLRIIPLMSSNKKLPLRPKITPQKLFLSLKPLLHLSNPTPLLKANNWWNNKSSKIFKQYKTSSQAPNPTPESIGTVWNSQPSSIKTKRLSLMPHHSNKWESSTC